MAKYNMHSNLLLPLTLSLQIIIISSQHDFLEAVTFNHNQSSGSRPRCAETERNALLQFKGNLTDPSGGLSSWVGDDCCEWIGVGCNNRTGNVIKLDLGAKYFKERYGGKLSLSLIELSHLNYLNLSQNSFYGMVPPQLGNLSNLHYLDLSWNSLLWVSDLNWLSGLTSLDYLNFLGVNLSKASTNWLKAVNLLPSLSELHLDGCNLEYPISPPSLSISNLTSLLVIDLSNNELNSEVPPWLFNITTLMDLDLSFCSITGSISHLPWHSLRNMDFLNLQSNSINDDIGTFIDVLSEKSNVTLKRLNLLNNHFSGQLGESLGRLTSLISLCLNDNSISGAIPPSIGMLSFLEELQLSHNKMNGSLPESIGGLSSLIYLGLSDNNWTGKLSEVRFTNLRKLKSFYLSCPKDFVFDVSHDWIPPFSLEAINITYCQLGPAFPPWIQTQTELTYISLADTQISDTIPDWFWNLSNSQVIDLSHNHLHGPIPLWSNLWALDLSYNSFSGPIPTEIGTIMSSLKYLDLSLNFLNGAIPKSISNMKSLNFLNLARNNLSGQITGKWDSLTLLRYLDLSNNGLIGEIPMSICASSDLIWLDFSDNSFEGRLPLSLQNCTGLLGLNLGGNRFSGNIPRWLRRVCSLGVLSLRMNKLTGNIPQELCGLPNLHALDSSNNYLTGLIPSCLGSLSRLTVSAKNNDLLYPEEAMDFVVKGRGSEFSSNLYLLNIVDLSNNNLTGTIPDEIANLEALVTLNLSRNLLRGNIPDKIGRLKLLETLDLSHNYLSGRIPESMVSLTFLNTPDFSCNNLSGPIPSGGQISTFNNSIYEGNTGLCGPPLPNSCDILENDDPDKGKAHKGKRRKKLEDDEMFWFYVSLGVGFIMGFWGLFGVLAMNRSWRIAFFKYFEGVEDRIFVFVAVKKALLKRMMEIQRD